LVTVLKSAALSDCVGNQLALISGSSIARAATASLVFSAVTIALNAVLLLFKSRSKSGWALAERFGHNWQAAYLIIVSLQKVTMAALVVEDIIRESDLACVPVSSRNQLLAASFLWNIATFWVGFIAMLCDFDSDFSPALRRSSYGLLTLCSTIDATGSIIWGNVLASGALIPIGSYEFPLDRHITLTLTSQVGVSLYFLVTSLRSSSGRAWSYAPLRFELSASVCLAAEVSLSQVSKASNERPLATADHCAAHSALDCGDGNPHNDNISRTAQVPAAALTLVQDSDEEIITASFISLPRMRAMWRRFQNRQIARCRVFVVPCTIRDDGAAGPHQGLQLARPLLNLTFLRPLHRLADIHTNYYVLSITLLGVCSFLCQTLLSDNDARGQASLCFNFAVFVLSMGFISSKRNNLDKVAAMHVISSFRFLLVSLFLLSMIALSSRTSFIGTTSPWQTLSAVVLSLIFLVCALLDCSPHLPPFSQTCISVTTPSPFIHMLIYTPMLMFTADSLVCHLRALDLRRTRLHSPWQPRLLPPARLFLPLRPCLLPVRVYQPLPPDGPGIALPRNCSRQEQLRDVIGELKGVLPCILDSHLRHVLPCMF
jgi:hypothetical protein